MASVNVTGENQNDNEQGYIEELPDVALIEILSYLHATEVENVTMISRRVHDLSLTRTAGRNVNLSRCHNCTLSWLLGYVKSLSDVMRGSLDLSHNLWISAKSLEKLTNLMTNVTSLDVTGCCISEQCMHKILCKATKLHTLAYTDRAFNFSSPQEDVPTPDKAFSEDSLQTLARLAHLSITFLTCSNDLSLVAYCPKLTALRLDQHLNTARRNCDCSFQHLNVGHFSHLSKYCQTRTHSNIHTKVTDFMKNVVKHLLLNGTNFTELIAPAATWNENAEIATIKLDDTPCWASNLSHADVPYDLQETVPSLRYLRTDIVRLKNVGDGVFIKQFPNLQYLCLCQGTSEKTERLILELLPLLAAECPHIVGLCFPGIHVHPTIKDSPVAQALGRLKKLQYLSISPCAFEPHSQDNHSIFDTEADIREKTLILPNSIENHQTCDDLGKDIYGLVQACLGLTQLELVYPETKVYLRYPYDFPSIARYEGCRAFFKGTVPTDATLSALGCLRYLQRLTLGGALGVRHGTGFTTIFKECRQLSYLSLADFGLRGQCLWMPAFCDALKYATSLQDLRIEHKNLDISSRLQSSLRSCKRLRRLCLMSEKGRIEQPSCFMDLLESCTDLCLLVVCSNDSLALRAMLRIEIRRKYMFKETRPALSVVFGSTYELKTQVGQEVTLKSVPNVDIGELVLFRHHVCNPERHDGIT